MFGELLALFFPRWCVACERLVAYHEHELCTRCLVSLPHTDYHLRQDNPVIRRFYGHLPIHHATALYHFTKPGPVQRLLYQAKYQRRPRVLTRLGTYYGTLLRQVPAYRRVEVVVPVPLHRRRLQARGYNQSAWFARGLAASLHVPCHDAWLVRRVDTPSQTAKSGRDRWRNVQGAFQHAPLADLQGRRLLLVDDLITTGATLHACAQVLLAGGARTVSLVALAYGTLTS